TLSPLTGERVDRDLEPSPLWGEGRARSTTLTPWGEGRARSRTLSPLGRGQGEGLVEGAAAVDGERGARDERRLVTGQVQRGLRDLVRLPGPLDHVAVEDAGQLGLRIWRVGPRGAEERRVDDARADRVDPNVVRRQVNCEGL